MRWRAWLSLCLGAASACGRAGPTTSSPRSVLATADTLQLSVLRDLLTPLSDGTRFCFDPNVATFSGPKNSNAPTKWAPDVLREVSRSVPVGVDSSAGTVPPGVSACARSRTLWRQALGVPQVADSAGQVTVVRTLVDPRGGIDSLYYIFRLERRQGRWSVPGWNGYWVKVNTYVHAEGCYRFEHVHGPWGDWPEPFIIRVSDLPAGRDIDKQPIYRFFAWNEPVRQPPKNDRVITGQNTWHATHDSLHFVWGDPMSWRTADMHVVGDSLYGTMRWETDAVVPNPPQLPIRAAHVPCPTAR